MKQRLKAFLKGLTFRRKRISPKKRFSILKKLFLLFLFFGLAVFAGGVIWLLVVIVPNLPDVNDIENLASPESSVIMDREGNVLYTLYGNENRETVALENISQHAIDAIIAIEDDKFYSHQGVDVPAVGRALLSEFGFGSARGGSTLTQQFVRNAIDEIGFERSYTRKITEMISAVQLESHYSKDKILELYLNRVNYSGSIYGIETAAQKFFGKPAAELTIAEGAILAAIPNRPTYFSPYGDHKHTTIDLASEVIFEQNLHSEQDIFSYNPDAITQGLLGKTYYFDENYGFDEGLEVIDGIGEVPEEEVIEAPQEEVSTGRGIYVKGRTDLVLNRMLALEYITEKEYDAAIKEIETIEFLTIVEKINHPHFVFHVREQLEEKFGADKVEQGGLRVMTTLDPALQEAAVNAVTTHAETNLNKFDANNAALISVDPETGHILAMVGSVDYFNEEIQGNVNSATTVNRSPGSSFKPFTYAAAFLHGSVGPETVFYDLKTSFYGGYTPNNYDGSFSGPVTIRAALGRSLNISAVKAAQVAGVQNLIDLCRKLGLDFQLADEDYGLSLALGATETGPLQMVSAYSTFANGGYKLEPVSILSVVDKNGNILEEYTPKDKDLIVDPEVAFLINDILADVNARPAGFWRQSLSLPGKINAAKTGTSNEKDYNTGIIYPKDTWTIGYTPQVATAVWVGNTDGRHMNTAATGLGAAAPIWKQFMIEATKDHESTEFDKPAEISVRAVNVKSGKLATGSTPKGNIVSAYFPSFAVPLEDDGSHYRVANIDTVSGKLATEFTPAETTVRKAYYIPKAYLDDEHWQRPVTAWAMTREGGLPPTQPDDVHTAESMRRKPGVVIRSPGPNAVISPPRFVVSASVDTSESGEPVSQVAFYLNGTLVGTATSPPYSVAVPLSANEAAGSIHTIKARVTDRLSRSSENTIQVKVGADEVGPTVRLFTTQTSGAYSPGSSMFVRATANDVSSGVAKVSFYIDDTLVQSLQAPPFNSRITLPESSGRYDIKVVAVDRAGNQSTDVTTVTVDNDTSSAPEEEEPGEEGILEEETPEEEPIEEDVLDVPDSPPTEETTDDAPVLEEEPVEEEVVPSE